MTVSLSNLAKNETSAQFTSTPSTIRSGKELPPAGKDLPDVKVTDTPKVEVADLEKVTEHLNEFIASKQRSLRFSMDVGTGRTVVKVVNMETQEVIRQYPPEQILDLARMLKESLDELHDADAVGFLVEEQG